MTLAKKYQIAILSQGFPNYLERFVNKTLSIRYTSMASFTDNVPRNKARLIHSITAQTEDPEDRFYKMDRIKLTAQTTFSVFSEDTPKNLNRMQRHELIYFYCNSEYIFTMFATKLIIKDLLLNGI